MDHREKLAGQPAFQRFEKLTGMRLSEKELEAYEQRAKEGGMSILELFDRASDTIERNMARAQEAKRRTLH
ncbi:hypothetical protein [Methylobacterium oryzae]|uniref:hypothetical protein n=1 Tax=Methylobacterium oryzae TaxID=334852 RepID=UPI001F1B180E|nr:hypothetical protein [Methylobacterium oryzae]UIN38407.1 hypothetical protein LXM90_30965 [Methylobacterium oryzae]